MVMSMSLSSPHDLKPQRWVGLGKGNLTQMNTTGDGPWIPLSPQWSHQHQAFLPAKAKVTQDRKDSSGMSP